MYTQKCEEHSETQRRAEQLESASPVGRHSFLQLFLYKVENFRNFHEHKQFLFQIVSSHSARH